MRKKFDEIFEDCTKLGTKIRTDEYHPNGKHPIIDQGQEMVAGFTDLEDGLFDAVPAIVFGDHTRIIKYVDYPFFLGADGVKVLRSKVPDANYRYLYYALENARIPNTGYNRHYKWLKELEIEYPPISQQIKTVKVLDEVESIIHNRQNQLQKLDELVKARFVELFGDCKSMVSMNELCSIITDGTHQPPRFQESGIPFIFVSNLVGNVVTYNAEKFISEDTYAELYKRTPIEIGDLLLSTVGSYGHPAVVTEDRKFLFQRHIAYLKPQHNMVNSFYLHSALLAPDGQRQIEEKVKGIAQKTLNLSEIKKIVVPLPTIEEQNQFEKFVNQTDKSKVVALNRCLYKTRLKY
jgi:restriction endonuclease S subunit